VSYQLLEPFTSAWLKKELAVGGPSLTELPVDEARMLMRQGQGETPTSADLLLELHHSPMMDFYVLRPRVAHVPLPVLVYLHGGGWVLGDIETHKRLMQDLVHYVGCAIVFPEYPRAPEAQFPVPVESTFAFLEWLVGQGMMLNLDTRLLALAGDSSGGNLAAVMAVLAKQHGGPTIRLQALLYPVTDCDFTRESYKQFGSGFFLDTNLIKWFWQQYSPNPEQRTDPRACPLRTPLNNLIGVAPALVITAECDILRDEGEAYASRLRQAGVPTALWRSSGTVHSFLLVNELSNSEPAKLAIKKLAEQLRDAFVLKDDDRPDHLYQQDC